MLNAVTWLLAIISVTVANDSFVETFNGSGPYESPRGVRKGLDNPGWGFVGDGVIRDGGYAFLIAPNRDGFEVERVHRALSHDCSFVERIEIRDAFLGVTQEFHYPTTASSFLLGHTLSSFPEGNLLNVLIHEADTNLSDWELITAAGMSQFIAKVPSGTHIGLEMSFDAMIAAKQRLSRAICASEKVSNKGTQSVKAFPARASMKPSVAY
jgi:hypothetical protein